MSKILTEFEEFSYLQEKWAKRKDKVVTPLAVAVTAIIPTGIDNLIVDGALMLRKKTGLYKADPIAISLAGTEYLAQKSLSLLRPPIRKVMEFVPHNIAMRKRVDLTVQKGGRNAKKEVR